MRRGRGTGTAGEGLAGARVRRFEARDIDRAIALTDLEGWGYTRADFLRLLALNPSGCFVAEDAASVVGVLSTTRYERLAFLGAVIVQPDRRGQGIGDAMMRAALDHLDGLGVESVRLNSLLHVIPFYERLGFRGEYENVRWIGTPPVGGPGDVRVAHRADVDRIVSWDQRYFGSARAEVVRHLMGEFSQTFLVAERDGEILGYIVANTSSPDWELGPWVVDPEEATTAADLFRAVMNVGGAKTYGFTAPTPNATAGDFARDSGCRAAFRTLRMVRGRSAFPGDPKGIWALAGLEKG